MNIALLLCGKLAAVRPWLRLTYHCSLEARILPLLLAPLGCIWIDGDEYAERRGQLDSASGCDAVFYADDDDDGYGNPDDATTACDRPDGYVNNGDDCDDADADRFPGVTWYVDGDADGFGRGDAPVDGCDTDAQAAPTSGDCNDADAAIHPEAPERCATTADDNCDGLFDTEGAEGCVERWTDVDGDGYGTGDPACFCNPDGDRTALQAGDCEDAIEAVSPEGVEVCGDGLDNDCDGTPNGCRLEGELSSGLVTAELAADQAGATIAWHDDQHLLLSGGSQILGWQRDETTPSVALTPESANDELGFALAVGGRADTDANHDLAIGAPGLEIATEERGAIYLVLGPVSGVAAVADAAEARLVGAQDGDRAGVAVAFLRDIDADGHDEIVVGARGGGSSNQGDVVLVPGDVAGDLALAAVARRITGPSSGDLFGNAVATGGDLDADGFDDLVVGAPLADGTGVAYVFSGATVAGVAAADDADATLRGSVAGGQLGVSVAMVPDHDGDGDDEVLLGAQTDATVAANAGAAYLLEAPLAGEVSVSTAATARLVGATAQDRFGSTVAAADVDGNGFADLLVGARTGVTGTAGGAVYVFYGPVTSNRDAGDDAHFALIGDGGDGLDRAAVVPDFVGLPGTDLVVGAPSRGTGALLLVEGAGF